MTKQKKFLIGVGLLVSLVFLFVVKISPESIAAKNDINTFCNAITGQGCGGISLGNTTTTNTATSDLSGYKIVTSPNTCSTCRDSAAEISKLAQENGLQIVDQGKNDGGVPRLQDSNGKTAATGVNEMKNKIEELKKNLKPNTDKCILITPGMSSVLGKMYGETGAKAYNDKHDFRPVVEARCGILAAKEGAKGPIFSKIDNFGTGAPSCFWAVDYAGKDALYTESEKNYNIRVKQATENVDPFSVTFDDDLKKITETGANSEIHKGKEHAGQSNEQINTESVTKNGGTVKKKESPNEKQHMEYWNSPKEKRGYEVGSGKKIMFAGSPLTAGDPAKSVGSDKMDVDVTNECDYTDNTKKSPDANKPKTPNNSWSNGSNPGSNSPNGPGGGGGGEGEEGGLSKILPALMQALQAIKPNNQQGQGTSSTPTPTPSPSAYICDRTKDDIAVCGIDGETYANQCIAEYENQTTVKHEGICTDADKISVDDSVSLISQIIAEITNSGIPQNTVSTVVNIVTNIILKMFATGSADLPQPTVVP